MVSAAAKRSVCTICAIALTMLAAMASSSAAQITIVAVGTSNTVGRGLPPQQSYPAQLQAMLKSKGYNVRIINKGVNGDTTAGMLARINSVPNGTRLVLLEYGRGNEVRRHIANSTANMAAIQSELAARNIKSIDITSYIRLAFQRASRSGNLISANGPHLNASAYGEVAAQVLPQVEAAIGR
jgi:acyl-CoA thioesterase I